MICNHCGQELPEGTRFCRYCGAEQAEAVPTAEPAPFALNLEGELPQEMPKEKKSNKLVGWIIGGVAALAVLVTCLVGFLGMDWGLYIRDTFQRMKEPEEYKNIVEERALTEGGVTETAALKKVLTAAYGKTREAAELGGREVTLQLELGGKLRSLLEMALAGDQEALAILDSLQSVDLTLNTNAEDQRFQGVISLGLNGEHVAKLDVVLDVEGEKLYLTIPELNETALLADLQGQEELQLAQQAGSVLKDFLLRCPDEQTMSQLWDRYLLLALRQIDDVEMETDEIDAGGVTQKVTVLTYEISDETALAMALAVLEEAKDDPDVQDLIENFNQLTKDINRLDPEAEAPTLDADTIDQAIRELESLETSGETVLTVETYVNRKGQIVGRSYQVEDAEISYYWTMDGHDVGMMAYVKADGVKVTGEGSGLYKKGVLNGKLTLKAAGMELMTAELKDMDYTKNSGTILLRLGDDLCDMLAEELEIPSALLDISKIGVEVTYSENTVDMGLLLGSSDLLRLRLTDSARESDEIRLPQKTTEDGNAWLVGVKTDVLRDMLEKTGLHQDLIDAFLEGFVEGLTDTEIKAA